MLWGALQEGTIDSWFVLDWLCQVGYGGFLCVEYVHVDYIGGSNVDVVTETVKMRDLIRAHLEVPCGGGIAQSNALEAAPGPAAGIRRSPGCQVRKGEIMEES